MLIIEDPTVTVKCRTAIKVLFHYFRVCHGRDCMVSWIYNYQCNQCLSPF